METFTWEATSVSSPYHQQEDGWRTLISTAEWGQKQRRAKRQVVERTWRLKLELMEESTKNAIRTFFNNHFGAAKSFYWVNTDDDIRYEVNFIEDALKVLKVGYNAWNIEVGFIEKISG